MFLKQSENKKRKRGGNREIYFHPVWKKFSEETFEF
jgi:hypothetical protein